MHPWASNALVSKCWRMAEMTRNLEERETSKLALKKESIELTYLDWSSDYCLFLREQSKLRVRRAKLDAVRLATAFQFNFASATFNLLWY